MDDFIVELDWSNDLRSLQKICRQIFDITPNLVTNLPRSDYWKEVFESTDSYFRSSMWNKIKAKNVIHRPEYHELGRLLNKFHLQGDILFFVTCPEITPVFIPHRHYGESPHNHAGALMLPIIGTGAGSITKYAHWYDPQKNRSIDSYNYIKGRPEQTLIPDEEVAVEYCLHEKPAIFNRHQFHQVVNPTDHWRVVAHIPYDTEDWEDCKKFAHIN